MSLVLCHECLTWIEPRHEQCPRCRLAVDLSQPDPSPAELEMLFGPVVACWGEAYLRQKNLPCRGRLYRTAHGLCYLPDFSGRTSPGKSWTATFVAVITAPFSKPALLELPTGEDCRELVRKFMDSPGACFVARRNIVKLINRHGRLAIHLLHGTTLRMKLLCCLPELEQQILEFQQPDSLASTVPDASAARQPSYLSSLPLRKMSDQA